MAFVFRALGIGVGEKIATRLAYTYLTTARQRPMANNVIDYVVDNLGKRVKVIDGQAGRIIGYQTLAYSPDGIVVECDQRLYDREELNDYLIGKWGVCLLIRDGLKGIIRTYDLASLSLVDDKSVVEPQKYPHICPNIKCNAPAKISPLSVDCSAKCGMW